MPNPTVHGQVLPSVIPAATIGRTVAPVDFYADAVYSDLLITRRAHVPAARQSNGTNTGASSRLRFPIVKSATDIRLLYVNHIYRGLSGEGTITVRSSVEVATGFDPIVPVYFNGKLSVSIEPGGWAISDPIGIDVTAGANMHVRSFVQLTTGTKWCDNYFTTVAYGEGVEAAVSPVDKTVPATTITPSASFAFGPMAILGRTRTHHPVVGILGDSISAKDETTTWDATMPWIRTALGTDRACLSLAIPGEAIETFANYPANYDHRLSVLKQAGVSTVVVMYGTNDIIATRTFAQIQGWLLSFFTALANRGFRVIAATLPPNTTSSDSWATLANQTVGGSAGTHRTNLNEWIRSTPSPLYTYIDTADALESSRNSGKWKADGSAGKWTVDGTHPTQIGHTAMAALVDVAQFI